MGKEETVERLKIKKLRVGTEERLSLDVAISTYRPEGIKRVEKMLSPLSPQEGVKYIVSWQEHANAPIPESLLSRDDVEIHRLDIKGLSNNRNNAMDHCHGDIVLIADDDLEYHRDFAKKIIESFEDDPALDLATFKIDYLNKKIYPDSTYVLECPFPKNYYVSSVEIAFRRKSLKGLHFWNKMGLGNSLLACGEDELFVISAIKKNFNCQFVNKEIGSHSEESTGDGISPGVLRGQGFIIRIIYPFSFPIRVLLKSYRLHKKNKGGFLSNLKHLSKGAWISIISKIPSEYYK